MTDNVAFNYTLHQPRGIAGLISPWNLPLYLLSWKSRRPSLREHRDRKAQRVDPDDGLLLCRFAVKRVCRMESSTSSMARGRTVDRPSPRIRKLDTISFTGGTATGRKVAEACAPLFKKVSLELGGKNPNIFSPMPISTPQSTAAFVIIREPGQVCLCGSRVFVERSTYKDFVERFVERTARLCLGDPLDETTDQGAIVNKTQLEKVKFYVDLAQKEGGKSL